MKKSKDDRRRTRKRARTRKRENKKGFVDSGVNFFSSLQEKFQRSPA